MNNYNCYNYGAGVIDGNNYCSPQVVITQNSTYSNSRISGFCCIQNRI
jgi:hypothetical protein